MHQRCITKAFTILESESTQIKKTIHRLQVIRIKNRKSFNNELFPGKSEWVCDRYVIEKNTIVYLASLILHELVHIDQYDRGVRNIHGRAERKAYKIQAEFLIRHGRQRDAISILKYFEKIKHRKYSDL